MISEVKSLREIDSCEGSRKALISFWLRLFLSVKGGKESPNVTGKHSLVQPNDELKRSIRKEELRKTITLFIIYRKTALKSQSFFLLLNSLGISNGNKDIDSA